MRVEELHSSEIPSLLELCVRALPLDTFSDDLFRARLLNEPNFEQGHRLCIRDGKQIAGAMLSGVRGEGETRSAVVSLFAVRPEYRRQGVALALLSETEARVCSDGLRSLRVGKAAPIYFWPGVDVRYTPALCLLEKHGYQRNGDAVNMQVDFHAASWDTQDAEARLASEGYEFRRLRPEDRSLLSDWLQQTWGETWAHEALCSYANDPISTWIAVQGERIRSFASYNVTGFANGFGPTGTEEACRGKGLGRILFNRCMLDLRALGYQTCEVCWVGPISFYARVADAWIHRVFWSLEKSL